MVMNGTFLRHHHPADRGCLEDQPQGLQATSLRLVEDDTAAARCASHSNLTTAVLSANLFSHESETHETAVPDLFHPRVGLVHLVVAGRAGTCHSSTNFGRSAGQGSFAPVVSRSAIRRAD